MPPVAVAVMIPLHIPQVALVDVAEMAKVLVADAIILVTVFVQPFESITVML